MIYDLCLITFAKADVDARSLNFIRTCAKSGMRTLYIALKPDSPVDIDSSVDTKFITIDTGKRMIKQWFEFLQKARPLIKEINTKNVVFSDLYGLPLITNFNPDVKRFYDSREIYSALGPLSGSKLKQRIITMIEKKFVKHVDEFIVSGELDAEYLKKHFKTSRPFHLIMNLPPYKQAEKRNQIREIFKIPEEKFILLYQGALVPGRGLLRMMDAIKELENAILVITGEGPFEQKLKARADNYELKDKVIFSGKISYDRLHDWTCSCDAGVVLFEPVSLSYKYALPNKLFEFFMAGKPVIATKLPAIEQVIEKYPAGQLIPSKLNVQDIVNAVLYLQDEKNHSSMAAAAKKAAKEYNYEAQAEKIIQIIRH